MSKVRHQKRAVRTPQPALLTKPSPPTLEHRRSKIVELLKNEGKIRVEQLADRLAVSQVTIRKDLDALERRGLLERSHGTAVFSQQSRFNIAFLEKLQIQASAKELIAQAAANHIHEGDSVILDSGTTTLALAKVLVGKFRSLFVITNSVPAALELTRAGYELLLVGGQVRNHSMALLGPMGLTNLENFHVDRAFMGTSGVTLSHGFSTPDSLDAQMKQAMMRIADKAYVVTDSSKFGHNCMVSFARSSDIHITLTDSGLPQNVLKEFRQHGFDIRTVAPNEQ
jgi:DeoR/GlpR family transcriptional regulator of sugar metabolism